MKYDHYIRLHLPEDERSSDTIRLLEMLRYAGVLSDEGQSLLIPKPSGLLVEGWSQRVIGRAASFEMKAELVRRPK